MDSDVTKQIFENRCEFQRFSLIARSRFTKCITISNFSLEISPLAQLGYIEYNYLSSKLNEEDNFVAVDILLKIP